MVNKKVYRSLSNCGANKSVVGNCWLFGRGLSTGTILGVEGGGGATIAEVVHMECQRGNDAWWWGGVGENYPWNFKI